MAQTPFFETEKTPERCLVVHPHDAGKDPLRSAQSLLSEAVSLAEAIGLDVISALTFSLRRVTPRTLIGAGQLEQCRELVKAHDLHVVILNTQLSPTQQRNLEKALGTKVIDRTALILEIFGERAQTAEGKLQVELAALSYQKSRLVRSWTHLERQRGGAGFMGGPGETQIETDRRLIAERIQTIKKQLDKVVRTRQLHRKSRHNAPYPTVALVGYTNAGKSSLFNRLTRGGVLAKDQLFATLDPTIRALNLPSGQKILLSDTVGFISHLPHELVAAFRATLEEVTGADLLLHVRDIAHPDSEAQAADVHAVLQDLFPSPDAMPSILEVWNKIDLLSAEALSQLPPASEETFLLSAETGAGCDSLLTAIGQHIRGRSSVTLHYRLAAHHGKALAWLHAHGTVVSQAVSEEGMNVTAQLRPEDAARFARAFPEV